ncbi:MAG TPA: tRNA uridine-5-carboxymethylaminomethyl(34) synthesis GTPase MnmE [bacterium]|nr:tRNA uridine-5-carboxymethylaminomethyl(34) synthesis GTPase MnmE [bacterium]
MYELNDTICAIATPPGMGGVGVIRLSGPGALSRAGAFLNPAAPLEKKRALLFRKLAHPQSGEILDEALVLVMPGPHSYTGEDVVEFHLHGSPALLSHLISLLTAQGLRLADPGEFTYRAFRAGRLDLTQAEAVEQLVSAQGEASRREALRHLTGGLAAFLEPVEEALKSLYLKIEARLEFSEDGIAPLDLPRFQKEVGEVQSQLAGLLQSYQQGKILKEGLSVALVGPPNVGKSSLLNRLLGVNRAIVTPQAGTTRDVIEGVFLLKGVPVRFFDTAGLRDSSDLVEAEGIRRSRQVLDEADFIFWILDSTRSEESFREWERQKPPLGRTWFLFNKEDLAPAKAPWKNFPAIPAERCLSLSCQAPQGLDSLLQAMEGLIEVPGASEGVLLTSARHQKEVSQASAALTHLVGLIESGQPYELWAEELKEAALAIGRVRGRNLPASAFEEIFTKFCIGK